MTQGVQNHPVHRSQQSTLRIASVSYLNATPLIYGLDRQPNRELLLDVPAKLIHLLRDERADVALLPVIDYQRLDNLCVVPSGGIGCDGETLQGQATIRVTTNQCASLDADGCTVSDLAHFPVTSAIGSTACLESLPCAARTIFDRRGL